jgi:hypothetical protein
MSEEQTARRAQSLSPAPAKAGAGCFKRLRIHHNALLAGLFLSTGAFVVQTRESGLEVAMAHPAAGSAVAPSYRDGPPAGFSGGFGEDHCQACHTGDKMNASPGRLTISAPERYRPGESYPVTITLTRPGMAIGGFQLTARFEDDSAQAGTLSPADGQQDRVKVLTDRGVQYAYHSRPGAQLTATDVVRWTLRWTAPAGRRAVFFNAAANAANGDDSQAGDFVYLSKVHSRGR